MVRAHSTLVLALSLGLGVGAAWLCGSVPGFAFADDARVGSHLTLYRTRAAPNSQFAGYSYSNFTGADFRDFALTVEKRKFELKRGLNTVRLSGVPSTLDRATVSLRSRTDPQGTKVVEQRLVYDLESTDRLLSTAKGKEIQVSIKGDTVTGTLLAYEASSITLKTSDKKFPVRIIRRTGIIDIRLAGSAGIVTSPTLEWKITAKKAGVHEFDLGYRAHGMTWTADYTAVYNPVTRKVDLSAYATIRNSTGSDFRDAKVRLVHRTLEVSNSGYGVVAAIDGSPGATKSFDLKRAVNSATGERVQLDLFTPITDRPARTLLVYEPIKGVAYSGYPNTDCYSYSVQPTSKTSYRYLEVDLGDTASSGSLPPGDARVFRTTKNGALELVSEEHIQLGGGGKKIRIKVGTATNQKATRKQLECRVDERAKELHEKVEITVKNQGKKAVAMVLRENMARWPSWTIESESKTGTSSGKSAREYRLQIKASGQASLTYSVKYSW